MEQKRRYGKSRLGNYTLIYISVQIHANTCKMIFFPRTYTKLLCEKSAKLCRIPSGKSCAAFLNPKSQTILQHIPAHAPAPRPAAASFHPQTPPKCAPILRGCRARRMFLPAPAEETGFFFFGSFFYLSFIVLGAQLPCPCALVRAPARETVGWPSGSGPA